MNNKVDEQGNIYVFITRKEMGKFLKSSSKTVIKVFKELEKARLIKQENQGKGKAYKIYVLDIYWKIYIQLVEKTKTKYWKFYTQIKYIRIK